MKLNDLDVRRLLKINKIKLNITFSGFAFVFCLLECSKLAPMLKAKNDAKPVLWAVAV
ncbi:MAG: hypothetical protein RL637_330 [Pseudomonadota bacterium]